MREQFEELLNDLGNASYLLGVMAKGAESSAAWTEIDPLRTSHNEMCYALEFVSITVKERVNTLYGLLEDMSELDAEPEEEDEDEKEGLIDDAEEPPAARTEEDILELFRKLDNGAKSDLYGYALGLLIGGAARARK